MQPQTRARLLFSVPGVVLALAAIIVAKPTPGTPVGPFGFTALAIVQLLAIWPAADAFAALYAPRSPARRGVAIAMLTVAVVLGGATFALGNEFWLQLQGARSIDFALGWLARGLWGTALVLPWCFAARCLFPDDPTAPEAPRLRDRVMTFLCAALVALAIPSGYAKYLFRQQTRALEAQLQEGRYDGAMELASRLAIAGSDQRIGELSIQSVRAELARTLTAYRAQLAAPIPSNATADQRVQRAALHAALGEYEAALRIIAPLTASHPNAELLAASVLDDLGRHADAAERYRAVIALVLKENSPRREQYLVPAYDGLAETLRDQRRIGEAEAAYLAGMRDAPAAAAHFHFQLGRHYALGGRPQAALASFQRAAELDPQQFGLDRLEVQQQLRPLHEANPTCLLPLPTTATPQPR